MKLEHGIIKLFLDAKRDKKKADVDGFCNRVFPRWVKQSKSGHRELLKHEAGPFLLKLKFEARLKEAIRNVEHNFKRFAREAGAM